MTDESEKKEIKLMKPPIASRPTAEPPPLMIGDYGRLCNRSALLSANWVAA